ncbi:MAG: glycosyltransferase family 4 protein [bacterium]
MRVLIIDKTAGLEASHERHQILAGQRDLQLHVLGPRYWIENRRPVVWRITPDALYTPHPGRVFFKDYYARTGYFGGLSRAVIRSKPDIIQLLEEPWAVTTMQTMLAAACFAPRAKILFYTWENIFRPWTYPSRASRLYAGIDKIAHHVSTAAVCATQGARAVLERKGYTKPIAVIPYGIPAFFLNEPPAASLPAVGRPFTLGYVGRLLYMKGIDLLLEALARLPDVHLLLVGTGEDETTYRQMSERLGVQNRVEWLPSVNERRVPLALRRMDAFVLASRKTSLWQEQLGRAALEAMATGIPVIGARSGAIPEVLGDAGLLFEENSYTSLAERITWLKDNPPERVRLGHLGRQRVLEHFTWERFAERLNELYRTLS